MKIVILNYFHCFNVFMWINKAVGWGGPFDLRNPATPPLPPTHMICDPRNTLREQLIFSKSLIKLETLILQMEKLEFPVCTTGKASTKPRPADCQPSAPDVTKQACQTWLRQVLGNSVLRWWQLVGGIGGICSLRRQLHALKKPNGTAHFRSFSDMWNTVLNCL